MVNSQQLKEKSKNLFNYLREINKALISELNVYTDEVSFLSKVAKGLKATNQQLKENRRNMIFRYGKCLGSNQSIARNQSKGSIIGQLSRPNQRNVLNFRNIRLRRVLTSRPYLRSLESENQEAAYKTQRSEFSRGKKLMKSTDHLPTKRANFLIQKKQDYEYESMNHQNFKKTENGNLAQDSRFFTFLPSKVSNEKVKLNRVSSKAKRRIDHQIRSKQRPHLFSPKRQDFLNLPKKRKFKKKLNSSHYLEGLQAKTLSHILKKKTEDQKEDDSNDILDFKKFHKTLDKFEFPPQKSCIDVKGTRNSSEFKKYSSSMVESGQKTNSQNKYKHLKKLITGKFKEERASQRTEDFLENEELTLQTEESRSFTKLDQADGDMKQMLREDRTDLLGKIR